MWALLLHPWQGLPQPFPPHWHQFPFSEPTSRLQSLRSAVTFATAVVALMGAAASFVAWSGHRLELPSLGQLCGASSVVIWLVSQIPQMVKNQRHRKAEDLSIDFLLLWTLGDLCNLAGCFLIEGTITQRVLAVYFVMCNAVLLLQWWNFGQPAEKGGGMSSTSQAFWFAVMGGSALGLARCLVCGLPTVQIGDYLGWVSAGVYLLSRLPQLWRNFVTQKVDDLAPSLFLLAALGNATYAASILAVPRPRWNGVCLSLVGGPIPCKLRSWSTAHGPPLPFSPGLVPLPRLAPGAGSVPGWQRWDISL
eukprot:GGOE01019506.1.p1 GENE.GGOE01019506.1~~GGOE01019506.1.p1  ORF type:complete len:307 (-),score=39.46 GGOE01019506.1:162-1082(-)